MFNSKINVISCISFFNKFDIFYLYQLLTNSIFQFYYKYSESLENITIFFYFPLFYFSIFTLYATYFENFYENILITNFIGFLLLIISDNGLIYSNLLLSCITFFAFWIMMFLLVRKLILKELNIFSNKTTSTNFEEECLQNDFLEDINCGVLIINQEKEYSNLTLDQMINDCMVKKKTENKINLVNLEEFEKKASENIFEASSDFIIKENLIFLDIMSSNESKNSNFKENILSIIESKEEIKNQNINNYEKTNLKDKISDFPENYIQSENNKFSSPNSFLSFKKNELFSPERVRLNNINNNKAKSFMIDYDTTDLFQNKLFLINNKKFIQILFETDEFNYSINEDIYENYILVIDIIKRLIINYKEYQPKILNKKSPVDSLNYTNENNNLFAKSFETFKIPIKLGKLNIHRKRTSESSINSKWFIL